MQFVRNLVIAAVFAAFSAGMASASPAAPLQKSLQEGPGLLLKVQDRCETLRRACASKGELGEVGEGNCRRYREECGQHSASDCARLRSECLYKSERGEQGEGNCRRYREECRG